MMRTLLALAVCEPSVPLSLHVDREHETEIVAAVETGPFPVRRGEPAPIHMFVAPHLATGDNVGEAIWRTGCRRLAWSIPSEAVVLHELGHLFGLEHVDDAENLMHPSALGSELTAKQLRIVDREARALEACP